MSYREPHDSLEAQLRAVPLPSGLLARLRAIGEFGDHEVDALLADVAVPPGLVERLKRTPANEALDERIRDVPVPVRLLVRANCIAYLRPRSRILEWATAVALLLAVGSGVVAPVVDLVWRMRGPQVDVITLALPDQGPLGITAETEEAPALLPAAEAAPEAAPPPTARDDRPEFALLPVARDRPLGPAGELRAEMGKAWNPWHNWLVGSWGVMGYAAAEEERRFDLEAVPLVPVRGLEAPLSHAVDREFLFSHNSHPPILVNADAAASAVALPLCTRTDSFDWTSRLVAERRLPEPDQVRVEDFLAAMDYRLAPAPPGGLAIRTAAGPSVFNPGSAALLQVAVKAGAAVDRTAPACHLTVALDLSWGMGRDGRLGMVRRALGRFLGHLGPEDRFSLVAFHDEAVHVVAQAGRQDAERVMHVLDRLQASGRGDLGVGLRGGVAAALESGSGGTAARRLVVITNRDLPRPLWDDATTLLNQARGQQLEFSVLDLSDFADADAGFQQLAARTGGQVRQARSAEELRWALVETLTGQAALVARDARLRVAFNPKCVGAYRIVGHEATAAGGLLPGSVESDLRVGQEAVVLFEVWLRSNDEAEVAVARLEWRDAATEQPRQAPPQRISRLQFTTSFEGAPLPLQAAAVVAETAEVLRQGYAFDVASENTYRFRPRARTLQDVLTTARRVNPTLAARPEFQRYVTLLEDAQRLAGTRRPEGAKAGQRGLVAGRWRDVSE